MRFEPGSASSPDCSYFSIDRDDLGLRGLELATFWAHSATSHTQFDPNKLVNDFGQNVDAWGLPEVILSAECAQQPLSVVSCRRESTVGNFTPSNHRVIRGDCAAARQPQLPVIDSSPSSRFPPLAFSSSLPHNLILYERRHHRLGLETVLESVYPSGQRMHHRSGSPKQQQKVFSLKIVSGHREHTGQKFRHWFRGLEVFRYCFPRSAGAFRRQSRCYGETVLDVHASGKEGAKGRKSRTEKGSGPRWFGGRPRVREPGRCVSGVRVPHKCRGVCP